MSQSSPARRLLPYLIAIASFLAVCLVYFAPMIEGRTLQMHDVTQYEGMQADIQAHRAQYGEDPQWEGRLFGGMPAYLINVKYDSMVVRWVINKIDNIAAPACLIFLAMACFWCMCLLCGIDPWVGIVPALAYGLSTYLILILGAGHITKLVAMAYAPLMLGGVFYTFRTDMWRGAALTALFAAIQVAANHPQITYYFVLVLLAFWINELVLAIREKWLPRFAKITGLLAVAAVLALGANFIALYDIQRHSKYTTRGGTELTSEAGTNESGLSLKYATAWSYGVGETLNLFVPNLMGGSSFSGFAKDGPVAQSLAKYGARDQAAYFPAYWGTQPMTGGPTYLGAAALFLAVAGLFLLRGRYKWWIVAVSGVAIALAWGSNMMWFTELFFNFFPGYDKFRTVAMILVVVQWAVPMLGAMFLWKLWRGAEKKDALHALRWSLYILGGLALALILFGSVLFDFSGAMDGQLPADVAGAMRTERASMMRADAFRSLVYVALAFGAVWLWVRGTLKKGWALLLLAVLVTADLAGVDARFLPWKNFTEKRNTLIRPSEADKIIMADSTPGFRVANLTVDTFNDATTSYFHRSVGGYHGAKLQRYQDLIDRYLGPGDQEIYNMLNTRWVIASEQRGAPPVAEMNPDANGAAWFVRDAVFTTAENNADQELDALGRIGTKTTAVVDRRFKTQVGAVVPEHNLAGPDGESIPPPAIHAIAPDTIYMTDYRVNRQTYQYNAAEPRLAVFSEIYYPDGWTATLDGEPLDYFRADYLLRAAVLPAGEHTVVFSFAIPNFRLHSAITLCCTILILVGLLAAFLVPKYCCKRHGTGQ